MPDVTVIVPTRNRWRLLSTAIASALRQEGVDYEVIVVDDGSTDETPMRLRELSQSHEALRVIRHGARGGVAKARNTGIEQAKGAWLAFLDDDDLWAPSKLSTQLRLAREQEADFVYVGAVTLDDRLRPFGKLPLPDPATLRSQLLWRCVLQAGSSNVLARTELIRDLDGFDEELVQIADWDMWIRIANAGRAACSPDLLVGYRFHSDNMMLVDRADPIPELDYLVAKHRLLSREHGVDFDRVAFSRWIAWGHRRAGRRRQAARAYLRAAIRYRSPGDAFRALATLISEGLMRGFRPDPIPAEPEWLRLYRDAD